VKKVKNLIHLIIPLFALHLVEELVAGFIETDGSIRYLSQHLSLDVTTTFFIVQMLLFSFLALLLLLILFKKNIPKLLIVVLVIISLYEFVHVYDAIRTWSYYPGLITGVLISALGIYLASLIRSNRRIVV